MTVPSRHRPVKAILEGGPSKLRLGGAFDLFSSQTPGPSITDIQPAMRDNGNLIGAARGAPVHKTALKAAPNPFSALFDKLS